MSTPRGDHSWTLSRDEGVLIRHFQKQRIHLIFLKTDFEAMDQQNGNSPDGASGQPPGHRYSLRPRRQTVRVQPYAVPAASSRSSGAGRSSASKRSTAGLEDVPVASNRTPSGPPGPSLATDQNATRTTNFDFGEFSLANSNAHFSLVRGLLTYLSDNFVNLRSVAVVTNDNDVLAQFGEFLNSDDDDEDDAEDDDGLAPSAEDLAYPGGMAMEDICRLPVRTVVAAADATQHQGSCTICLEDYREGQDLRVAPCFHEFHQECLDRWLAIKRVCPSCRKVVSVRD